MDYKQFIEELVSQLELPEVLTDQSIAEFTRDIGSLRSI